MIRSMRVVAWGLVVGAVAACSDKPAPLLTQQDVAIANATTAAMEAPDPAVAASYYRVFGWMSPEEMLRLNVPYDPTMADGTRYVIQKAVDNNLATKGFQRGQPADFVIALSDVYFDNSRQAAGFGALGEEFTYSVDSAGAQSGTYMDQEKFSPASERLTFIFADAKTYKVLWVGRGDDILKGLGQSAPIETSDYYLSDPDGPKQNTGDIDAAVFQALAPMPVPLPSPQ